MDEDLKNLSKEELTKLLAEEKELVNRYYNYEQSVKRILNSIYGAFGNEWFYFFNIDIAESITLQGQDVILYAEKMLNKYAREYWHKDEALHKKLGIEVKGQVQNPVVIYIDTDSCYVTFQELMDNSTWRGTEKDFVLQIYKHRLKGYLEKIHEIYANNINGENFLVFELESIAKKGIWMAKKKYIQDIVWEDPDVHHDSLSKIKVKGFDTIQSSTPAFARKHLTECLKILLSQDKPNIKDVVQYLKNIKKEFKLADTEDIAFSLKCNGYDKYIIDDQKTFEFGSGCQYHVRGAGYHNFLLSKSKYKNKYARIGDGGKVKVYYTDDKMCDAFSYAQGSLPYEFAPQIDYEMQFEKCMLDPMNRVISVIGLKHLDRNLLYTSSLF